MILDSCFVIDLMEGDRGAVAKLDELTSSGEPLRLPSIVLMEVSYGLDSSGFEEVFEGIADEVLVPAFGREEAVLAADLRKDLDCNGKPIGVLDSMIAATALNRNESVVTRNVSHFGRVGGLTVSPY